MKYQRNNARSSTDGKGALTWSLWCNWRYGWGADRAYSKWVGKAGVFNLVLILFHALKVASF